MKVKKKEPRPAKAAVEDLLKSIRFDPRQYAVFETWDKEVRHITRGCTAVALQGSRLCVSVLSPVHRQEILFSKQRLIERVNQAMGKRAITDIVFEFEQQGDRN